LELGVADGFRWVSEGDPQPGAAFGAGFPVLGEPHAICWYLGRWCNEGAGPPLLV